MAFHTPISSRPSFAVNQAWVPAKPGVLPSAQDTVRFSGALSVQKALTFDKETEQWCVEKPVEGNLSFPESFSVKAEVKGDVESTQGSLHINRKGWFGWRANGKVINATAKKNITIEGELRGNALSREEDIAIGPTGKAVNVTARMFINLYGKLSGDAISQESWIRIGPAGKAVNAKAKEDITLQGKLSGDAISQESRITIGPTGKAVNATAHSYIELHGKLSGDITLTGAKKGVGAPVLFIGENAKLGKTSRIIFENENNETVPGLIVHPDWVKLSLDESFITGNYTVMSQSEYSKRY